MKKYSSSTSGGIAILITALSLLISSSIFAQNQKISQPVPSDHTLIIKHLLENISALKKSKAITKTSTSEEILTSLIKVTKNSPALTSKMESSKSGIYTQKNIVVSNELKQVSEEAKKRINVKNCSSFAEYKKKLLAAIADPLYDKYPAVRVGLKTALAFFEDGEKTIYSADYYSRIPGIKPMTPKQREAISKEVVKSDAEGAIGGAVSGCVATLAIGCVEGAAGGAVIGGVASSLATAVVEFLDLFF